jgi:hypothetical protein
MLTLIENDMVIISEHIEKERQLAVQGNQLMNALSMQNAHAASLIANLPAHLPGPRPTPPCYTNTNSDTATPSQSSTTSSSGCRSSATTDSNRLAYTNPTKRPTVLTKVL